ncbi:hypothetical protein Taro_033041 [Colocasia esculenta]|uniref:Uncharacterized protein n=1 Tax=Colocasia esculenta TaxID=4460 RepID=A0A843VZ00_COLES|nr:hypothetical protein [Colocasia esculenta]
MAATSTSVLGAASSSMNTERDGAMSPEDASLASAWAHAFCSRGTFRSKPPGTNPSAVLLDLNPQLGPIGTNPNKVLLDTNL